MALQPPHVLLIDAENCPQSIDRLDDALARFSRVVLVSGPGEPRIPLRLASVIASAVQNGSLCVVRAPRKGKNAADFAMAFFAGRLCETLPPDAEITVLSCDQDLNHVVELVAATGRKATRSLPSAARLKSVATLDQALVKVRSTILSKSTARPRSRKKLLSAIRSSCAPLVVDPASVLDRLVECGDVEFAGNGIDYPDVVGSNDNDDLPF